MNLVYGQADRTPARCLGGDRFKSCRELKFFFFIPLRDMLIISSSQSKNRREIEKNTLKIEKNVLSRASCASSQPALYRRFLAIPFLFASKMAQ